MAKIMEVKVGVIKAPSVSVSFYNKGYFLFFFHCVYLKLYGSQPIRLKTSFRVY